MKFMRLFGGSCEFLLQAYIFVVFIFLINSGSGTLCPDFVQGWANNTLEGEERAGTGVLTYWRKIQVQRCLDEVLKFAMDILSELLRTVVLLQTDSRLQEELIGPHSLMFKWYCWIHPSPLQYVLGIQPPWLDISAWWEHLSTTQTHVITYKKPTGLPG